ncbi:MAG TPA: M23 family metallopeptidase [Terracidiphilus sp.]|nr:M23 family metallopeptidase [Terracidiphilus sp.]
MTCSTYARFATVALCLAWGIPAIADSPIVLMPADVEVGSPELIRVEGPPAASIEGEWLGRKLQFFRGKNGRSWFALAGVDVEANPGPSILTIRVSSPSGGPATTWNRPVEIHAARYRTSTLSVPPKFVQPGPEQMEEIKREREIKDKVFAASATEPLWRGSFRAPVHATPTDSFGTRRVFNGKLDSVHTGMDFRAHMGTVVRASNSGVVVLAQPLYYEGNCVVIDHGEGLFTLSMHFSRIDVHPGEHVVAGQKLGLSGATGRVTGPHLHWAVRWQGAYVDPAKLLRLNLDQVR